jgi:microcin C transport system substrate-binding protein
MDARLRGHDALWLILFLILGVLISLPALADDPKPQPAIAMHGAPKYAAGFAHFDYVNPDAPKTGTLKLGWLGTFDSLNPFIVRGVPAMGLGSGYVYESLMARSWDEPFTLYGLIAASVEVPEDRSSIIFNIRPEAHWQDGNPITADDVIFSFETLRDHGKPNHRTYYKKVEKAEKLDERRVKFTFRRAADGSVDHEMPLIMCLMPILPQHDWQDRIFDQTTLRIPVGSGPYKLTAVDPGHSVTYELDPNYWGKDVPAQKGLFNFGRIRIDYYRDDSIALEAFKAGQYDLRREADANRWATAYDFPAAHDGRVDLARFPHHRPEPVTGFVLNMRKPIFKDPVLREAVSYAFDFGWINRNLFHGQYHRTQSFFPNSELQAPPLPEGKELAILEQYRAQLPSAIFTAPVALPDTDGTEDTIRAHLLKAADMLRTAGYTLHDDQLYAPNSQTPVNFEILLADPAEEKVALAWARTLHRLGIHARVHTVDSAQDQARLANFDFDVTTGKWINTLSPGNEQIFYWGSDAADQKGSRNYPGIKDPVVDGLAAMIPAARTREDLIAATHALDRALMAGHYMVPFYYLGADQVAYWTAHLHHPDNVPLYGFVLESWWLQ